MSLSDVVNVSITRESSALTLPGFGTPLILGVHSHFAERLRYYTKLADLLTDGFLTSDAIYKQAAFVFSQRPRPTRVAIGRRAAAVAQTQVIVTPAAPGSSTLYRVHLNGTNIDFTTDGSATQAELRDGLILAFNNSNTNPWAGQVTASASGNNILLTAATAGIPFTVTIDAAPASNPLTLAVQTQLFVIPASPDDSVTYSIRINGYLISFVVDSSSTQAELQAGLIAAIDAHPVVGPLVNATTATNDVLVTAVTGGTPFTFAVVDTGTTNDITLGAATGLVSSSGIAEDLAAIQAEQPDWYGVLVPERDAATIMETAAAVEPFGARKLFFAQTGDSAVADVAFDGTASNNPGTDIGTRLSNINYARTALWYHADSTEYLDAGIEALCLARVPGSYTAKFKEVTGVTPDSLSATQRTNLKAKHVNWYEPFADRAITAEGTVAEGEYIDVIHGIDKLYSRIQQLNASTLLKNPKVPFTSGGFALLAADVTNALGESTADGLIAESRTLADGTVESPAYTVTPPRISDIPTVDRAARELTASHPILFEGTLAGAIHALTISGSVAV